MSEARFQSAADLLGPWRDDVLSGKPPTLYRVGQGFDSIEIGPGLVTLIGGPPGAGKTALTMQWVLDSLIAAPSLKAVVCNVEMSPSVLLDRQLARLAGIDLSLIRHRRLMAGHAGAVERGMQALDDLAGRLAFVRPPFDLGNVAVAVDAFGGDLVVLDYVQRIGPPTEHSDRRGAVAETMDYLRQFADAGTAIIVVAALARSKDKAGRSSYTDGLNLASFRETSELEYGADDAYILTPASDATSEGDSPSFVALKHLKSRHGEPKDIPLTFDGKQQRFVPTPAESALPGPAPRAGNGKLHAAMKDLWARTPSARGAGGKS